MKTSFKKLMAMALVLIMVVSALPVSAMAEYGAEAAKSVPGIMDKVWEGWRDQWLGQLAGRISGRPAQKMQAEAVDGAYVKIDAPNLALPAGTEVRVVKLNDSDMEKVRAIAENTPGVNVETVSAYDITFFCNGKEIEPNGNVRVDMSLIGVEEGRAVSIYHIDAKAGYLKTDMTCEKVENVEISDGVASFKANAFSIFFVSEHNTSDILKVEFYDTKGQLVNTQPIMAGDFVDERSMPIYDPGIILSTADHGTRFEGWGKVSNPGDTPSGDPLEIDGVNKDVAINFSDYISSNNGIVKYKAVNIILGYAEFYDLNKDLLRLKNVFLDGNLRGDVEFNVNYKPEFNDYETTGWVLEQYITIDPTGTNPPTYKENEAGFYVYTAGSVGEDLLFGEGRLLKFYPYVKSGTWLNFNTNEAGNNTRLGFDGTTDWNHKEGSKATAVDSVFYDNGIVGELPAAPTRPGYTFGGWYKDRACTDGQEFTTPTTINGQTTIYAKWNPTSSSILVTVWVERIPDDDIDGNFNELPQYEYYTTIRRGADSTLNFNLLSNTVTTASEYTVSSSNAAGVLTLVNSVNDPNNPNESLRRIYGPVDDHYFVLDKDASNVENGVIKAMVRGDGQSVLNLYFERREIKIKVYASSIRFDQFVTINEEDAKTTRRVLFCKPTANGFYESVTSVPLADGNHIYLKKGLIAEPQDDERKVFVVRAGTEYNSQAHGPLYIFNPSADYTSATYPPNKYNMHNNIIQNNPQIMEFEGKYEQSFSYWPDFDDIYTYGYYNLHSKDARFLPLALDYFSDIDEYDPDNPGSDDYTSYVAPYNRGGVELDKDACILWSFQNFTWKDKTVKSSKGDFKIPILTDWYDMPYWGYIQPGEVQNVGGLYPSAYDFDFLTFCDPYAGQTGKYTIEEPAYTSFADAIDIIGKLRPEAVWSSSEGKFVDKNGYFQANGRGEVRDWTPSVLIPKVIEKLKITGMSNTVTNKQLFEVYSRKQHVLHYISKGEEVPQPFTTERPLLVQETGTAGEGIQLTTDQSVYHWYSPNDMDEGIFDVIFRAEQFEAINDSNKTLADYWNLPGLEAGRRFANALPHNVDEHEHFEGWYADYTTTEEFDFNDIMTSDRAAYAKIVPDKYRVILHYETAPQGGSFIADEPSSAVMNYNDGLFDNQLVWNNYTVPDYKFVGWYYDPDYQDAVSIGGVVSDKYVDETYHVGQYTEPNTRLSGTVYEDEEDDFIAGRIDLYPLYKRGDNYTSVIRVLYDADEMNGAFSDGSIYRLDSYLYLNRADARVGTASTGKDDNCFDYWVLLDSEGEETDIRYYPGEGFKIDKDYAQRGIKITFEYKNIDGTAKSSTQTLPLSITPEGPADANKGYVQNGVYYAFDGWTPELAPVTAAATYTARYVQAEMPKVNVRYHLNLDTDEIVTDEYNIFSHVELKDFDEVFKGYEIPAGKLLYDMGWCTTAAFDEDNMIEELTAEDSENGYDVYAIWRNKVILNPGDAIAQSGNAPDFIGVLEDGNYPAPNNKLNFVWDNHSFGGWKIKGGDDTVYQPGDIIANPIFPLELIAQWLDGHNVIYHYNVAGNATTYAQFIPFGQTFDFLTASELGTHGFTRTGYTLDSTVYENADFTGASYTLGGNHASISADMHVYVKWNANPITVTFDPGVSTGNTQYTRSVSYDDVWNGNENILNNIFDAPNDNMRFVGWMLNTTNQQMTYPYTVTEDITLTAMWGNKEYHITFNDGGADGGSMPDDVYRDNGESYALPACGFTKTDYDFAGWSVGGQVKAVGDTIEITDHTTITATWEESGFKPITSTTFSSDKIYVIGYPNATGKIALLSTDSSSVGRAAVEVDYVNGKAKPGNDVFAKVTWTLSGNTNSFTAYNTGVDNYLFMSDGTLKLGNATALIFNDNKLQVVNNNKAWLRFFSLQYGFGTVQSNNATQGIVILEKNATTNNILPAPESAVLDVETKAEEKAVETTVEKTVEMTEAPVAKKTKVTDPKPEPVRENTMEDTMENTMENLMENLMEDLMDSGVVETYVLVFKAKYKESSIDGDQSHIIFDANGLNFKPATTAEDGAIDMIGDMNSSIGWTTGTNPTTGTERIISSDVTYYLNRADAEVYIPGPQVFEQYGKAGYRLIGWNTKPDGTGMAIHFDGITNDDGVYAAKFSNADATKLRAFIDNGDKSENNTRINTLYAMWEGYTAFYHSANGTIVPNSNSAKVKFGGNTVGGTLIYSTYYNSNALKVSIPDMVRANYLYGGYYKNYPGKGVNYADSGANFGQDDPNVKGYGIALVQDSSKLVEWNINDAITKRGDEFTVSQSEIADYIGHTLYIKEVPDSRYLRPYTAYTYDKNLKERWEEVENPDLSNMTSTNGYLVGIKSGNDVYLLVDGGSTTLSLAKADFYGEYVIGTSGVCNSRKWVVESDANGSYLKGKKTGKYILEQNGKVTQSSTTDKTALSLYNSLLYTEDGYYLVTGGKKNRVVESNKTAPENCQVVFYQYYDSITPIRSLWLVTDTDDTNYEQAGFIVDVDPTTGALKEDSVFMRSKYMTNGFVLSASNGISGGGNGNTTVNNTTFSNNRSYTPYVGYLESASNPGVFGLEGKAYINYWITPDSILVTGKRARIFGDCLYDVGTIGSKISAKDVGVAWSYIDPSDVPAEPEQDHN